MSTDLKMLQGIPHNLEKFQCTVSVYTYKIQSCLYYYLMYCILNESSNILKNWEIKNSFMVNLLPCISQALSTRLGVGGMHECIFMNSWKSLRGLYRPSKSRNYFFRFS